MDLGLTGRVAIVAAGSKGLGRAVARNSPAKVPRSPSGPARPAPFPMPPRTSVKALAKKSSTKLWMSLIPQRLPPLLPPSKPASAAWTSVLPIPAVLRLMCLRTPSRKSGVPLSTSF